MDLDHFKSVNDTYGHPVGDIVLVTVAKIIKTRLRDTDHVARFGGEEFTILLPGTTLEGARQVAEKIRLVISKCDFSETAESLAVTASFGVAPLFVDGETSPDRAYNEGDQALYRAKHAGRNRVEVAC